MRLRSGITFSKSRPFSVFGPTVSNARAASGRDAGAAEYLLFVGLPIQAIATGELLGAWAALAASRFAVEYLAMSRAGRCIGKPLRLRSFARGFLLHPIAIVVFGLLGNLRRPTWWLRPGAASESRAA